MYFYLNKFLNVNFELHVNKHSNETSKVEAVDN